MFLLQFRYPNSSTITYELLGQAPVRLGSAPDNTVALSDPSVSQHHAEIYRKGEKLHIKDLGSTNKTFLNNVAVVDALLNAPATVRLGQLEGSIRPSLEPAPSPSSPPPPFARLRVNGEVVHEFAACQITVGWKSSNLICLKDPSVSGQHAKITFQNGEYRITDLGSSNKTFINGKEVQEAPLKHGDTIHFGLAQVVFELLPAATAGASVPAKQTAPIAVTAPEPATSSELEAIRKELEQALKQKQALEQSLAESQNQHTLALAAAHTTITRLTSELEEIRKAGNKKPDGDLEAALKKIEQLTQQREAADTEAAALAAKLDDELRHNEVLAAANERLQAEVTELEARVAALTKERDAALERARKAELELATLRSKPKPKEPVATGRPVIAPTKPASLPPADPEKVKAFLDKGSAALNSLRQLLHRFIKTPDDKALSNQFLEELNRVTQEAEQAHRVAFGSVGRTLASLVADLAVHGQGSATTLRTVSQALDFLVSLLGDKNPDPRNAKLLAVEDDPDTRKVIEGALALVDLPVTFADSPSAALELLKNQRFDLILADVGLPEMTGFELCTRIRGLDHHRKTPVVFLTGAVSVQHRVQSSLSGGNDFIAKPFHLLELGVKCLIWTLKGQMER